ncbi:MAG TPA: DUF4267 domain-containing protein [Candidatus Baltobacteraceae bacterium]
MILDGLIWLAAAGALAVGTLGLIAPVPLSRLFGAPVGPGNATVYVRALGVRDIVLAIALAAGMLRGFPAGVSMALAAGALISAGDLVLVLLGPDRRFRVEYLCHALGFIACVVLAYLSLRR